MTKIRFRYKLSQGSWQPIIPLGIHLVELWERVDVYVDSGATYTVLQAAIAERNDFDYRSRQQISLQVGSGSLIRVFLHDLEVQLGTEQFISTIGFSDQMRLPLSVLGKVGIFDRFTICFNQPQKSLTFDPVRAEN